MQHAGIRKKYRVLQTYFNMLHQEDDHSDEVAYRSNIVPGNYMPAEDEASGGISRIISRLRKGMRYFYVQYD